MFKVRPNAQSMAGGRMVVVGAWGQACGRPKCGVVRQLSDLFLQDWSKCVDSERTRGGDFASDCREQVQSHASAGV